MAFRNEIKQTWKNKSFVWNLNAYEKCNEPHLLALICVTKSLYYVEYVRLLHLLEATQ